MRGVDGQTAKQVTEDAIGTVYTSKSYTGRGREYYWQKINLHLQWKEQTVSLVDPGVEESTKWKQQIIKNKQIARVGEGITWLLSSWWAAPVVVDTYNVNHRVVTLSLQSHDPGGKPFIQKKYKMSFMMWEGNGLRVNRGHVVKCQHVSVDRGELMQQQILRACWEFLHNTYWCN